MAELFFDSKLLTDILQSGLKTNYDIRMPKSATDRQRQERPLVEKDKHAGLQGGDRQVNGWMAALHGNLDVQIRGRMRHALIAATRQSPYWCFQYRTRRSWTLE